MRAMYFLWMIHSRERFWIGSSGCSLINRYYTNQKLVKRQICCIDQISLLGLQKSYLDQQKLRRILFFVTKGGATILQLNWYSGTTVQYFRHGGQVLKIILAMFGSKLDFSMLVSGQMGYEWLIVPIVPPLDYSHPCTHICTQTLFWPIADVYCIAHT